jgi:hypothetical protein
MKAIRLILWLAIMVPGWAVLSAFATLDDGTAVWLGAAIGALIGFFFGLVFRGNPALAGVGLCV